MAMDVFKQLRASTQLTENERMIAGFVLCHPEEACRMSSRELARRTYTSPSAVLRFVRRLGFDGFNDFKINIVSELKRAQMGDTLVRSDEPTIAICDKLARMSTRIVEETKRRLSMRDLEAIGQAVASTHYVDIYASDLNAALAAYAAHNFTSVGKMATVHTAMDLQVYTALAMSADHVAFLISKSGMDRALTETASLLKSRGVTTVAITSAVSSPLAGRCDYVLETFYYTSFQRFGAMVYGTSCKYLFDVLVAYLYAHDKNTIDELTSTYDEIYYQILDRSGVPGGSMDYYEEEPEE